MGNSYALPYHPTDMNWSDPEAKLYTRNGGANQQYLQFFGRWRRLHRIGQRRCCSVRRILLHAENRRPRGIQ